MRHICNNCIIFMFCFLCFIFTYYTTIMYGTGTTYTKLNHYTQIQMSFLEQCVKNNTYWSQLGCQRAPCLQSQSAHEAIALLTTLNFHQNWDLFAEIFIYCSLSVSLMSGNVRKELLFYVILFLPGFQIQILLVSLTAWQLMCLACC